jgi:large subunit ribosomal protein L29
MSIKNIKKELRKMNQDELKKELDASWQEQFNLRMQKGSGQSPKPNLLRDVRKKIARLHTLIGEKVRCG